METDDNTVKLALNPKECQPNLAVVISPDSQDLLDQLPVITEGLMSLGLVVDRVIGQANSELANLTEILPSKSDQERKKAIVDYVLQTRRQILKLLVLVRWSKEADNVAKCTNIIGFLARQNYEFDHSIQSLTEVKTMLGAARVRNYDLPTAITVLTSGTYTGLPSCIADTFTSAAPLSDADVIRTLAEMDEVLRYRLAIVERVPRRMRGYRIHDGRVTFSVAGMWEASMTYGGDDDDLEAQWYLLSIKFLFRVMDKRGVWSSIPIGAMKEHIVELCNRELLKLPVPSSFDSEGDVAVIKDAIEDASLVRGFNFLQLLTLSYQIEALYAQAVQMANTSWSGNLRVELSPNRRTLRLHYWIESRSSPVGSIPSSAPRPIPPNVSPSATIIVSFDSEDDSIAPPASSARSRALEAALNRKTANLAEKQVAEVAHDHLTVTWAAEEVDDDVRISTKLELTDDLSLAELLLIATKVHTREITSKLYDSLVAEGTGLNAEDIFFTEDAVAKIFATKTTPPCSIVVHLHSHQSLRLAIDPFSGRLTYNALGEVSAVREARLRSASEKANENRKLTAESLLRIRAALMIDEVDSRAVYLSLTTSRRLALRQNDLIKFGTNSRGYLFIHLSRHKLMMHYLVLVLMEDGFRFALIEVRNETDATQSWIAIEEIGWLHKSDADSSQVGQDASMWNAEAKQSSLASFDVSLKDLRELYDYCVYRIASFKIEQQLHLRRIPYKTVATASPSTISLKTPPYLVVQSSDLSRSTIKVAYPNVAIRCFLKADIIHITCHVRFLDLGLLKPSTSSRLPANISYDPKTSSITFHSTDIEACVTTFLTSYAIIAKAIVLARHHTAQVKLKKAV